MATEYFNSPLEADKKQIRGLCFDPLETPQAHEILSCRIEHVSLGTFQWPLYYAISYIWGDATKRTDIVINEQVVSVPEDAEMALRRLCPRASESTQTLTSRERAAVLGSAREVDWALLAGVGETCSKLLRRKIAHP